MNFVHSVRPHDLRYPHNAAQDIPSFAFARMREVLKTALTRSPAWSRGASTTFATDARIGQAKVVSSDAVWPMFVVKTAGDRYSLEPQLTSLAYFGISPTEAQIIAARFDQTAVH